MSIVQRCRALCYVISSPTGGGLGTLPSQEDLLNAQISQFTNLAQTAGAAQAQVVQYPSQEPPQAAHTPSVGPDKEKSITSQSSLVLIGEGLTALPRRLFEKIGANEYIDFTDLPPARGKPRSLPHHLDGQLLLVQLQDVEDYRRIIPDFPTWIQCFTIYSAALCLQHPQRLPQLLAYQAQMASYAKKFRWPTWVIYDQNYRQEKAATQDNNWSQIDTAIYTQCFMTAGMAQEDWCSSCNTLDHNSNNCPRNPPPPKRHKPQDGGLSQKTCDAYNAKGRFCTRSNCRFLHACQQCRGIHPLYRCPKQSSKGGSKRNPE